MSAQLEPTEPSKPQHDDDDGYDSAPSPRQAQREAFTTETGSSTVGALRGVL